MEQKKLSERGFLGRKFMAVALTGAMALGALGLAGNAQAYDGSNPLPGTSNTIMTQMPGQVLNQILNNEMRGGSRTTGDIMKGAGQRVVRQATNEATAKVNQAINQSVLKIFRR